MHVDSWGTTNALEILMSYVDSVDMYSIALEINAANKFRSTVNRCKCKGNVMVKVKVKVM